MNNNKVVEIKREPRNKGALKIANAIVKLAEMESTTEIMAFVKTDAGYCSVCTNLESIPELIAVLEMAKYDCLRKMTESE